MARLPVTKKMQLVTLLILQLKMMQNMFLMLVFVAIALVVRKMQRRAAASVEEMDDEEDDYAPDTNVEGETEAESGEEMDGSSCQISIAGPTERSMTSRKRSRSSDGQTQLGNKKRSRSSDGLTELVEAISKIVTACRERTEAMKGITSFFEIEAERLARRRTFFTEILQLQGFHTR